MANEEVSLGAGAVPTAAGGLSNGGASGSTPQDTVAVAAGPTTPPTEAAPGVLDALRAAFAGATARKALGWVLLVAWLVWLVALWVVQPRMVSQDHMADDIAQGRVIGYRLVTVDEDRARGPMSAPYSIDVYPASEPVNDDVNSDADGQQVTIAYWVDAPVAGLRVLDRDMLSSGAPAVLASLRSADVPETAATVLYRGAPARQVYTAGALLLLASTLAIILGPRPRRGTRWFWFWVVGGPFAVGIPVFAVAELLRPRYEAPYTVHPPGVAGRRSGLSGFGLGILLSVVGGMIVMGLAALSPVWFIRG